MRGVDVWVLEGRLVIVQKELVVEVLERAAVLVIWLLDLIDLLGKGVREGAKVPALDLVEVVVLVEVLDWVAVRVGTRASSRLRSEATAQASSSSQRILLADHLSKRLGIA